MVLKIGVALASLAVLACSATAASAIRFSDYAAKSELEGRVSPLHLRSARDRRYATVLRAAARQPANFAGHYVLASVGCGAGCIEVAALNRRDGSFLWLKPTVCCWSLAVSDPLTFQRGSRLLLLQGALDEKSPAAAHAFVLEKDGFRAIPP